MVLDAALAECDWTWLATEQDKLTYFTLTHRIPRQDLPSLTFHAEDAETVRYFPDKLPTALDADGRTHVFLYLLTQDLPSTFAASWNATPSRSEPCPRGPCGSWCRVTRGTRCRTTRRPLTSSSRRRSERVCWRACASTFTRAAARRRALTSDSIKPSAGPGRHLVDDVARRDGPQDGPVGVRCLTASVRTSLPAGRRRLTQLSADEEGDEAPGRVRPRPACRRATGHAVWWTRHRQLCPK